MLINASSKLFSYDKALPAMEKVSMVRISPGCLERGQIYLIVAVIKVKSVSAQPKTHLLQCVSGLPWETKTV